MTFWIKAVVVLILFPAAAVYAAARLLKPRLEKAPASWGWEQAVLVLGLPFTLGMAAVSILMVVYDEPYTEENTVELEVRITDVVKDESWLNFTARALPGTYQISSSLLPVFDDEAFLRDQDPDRTYRLKVDRDMYRIATGQISREAIDYPTRIDLLVFDIANEGYLVWVYEVRSGEETYLSLDEANRKRTRGHRVLLFFVVPVFLVGFVFDVLLVAGLFRPPLKS